MLVGGSLSVIILLLCGTSLGPLCDAGHLYSNRSARQRIYHWWKLNSGFHRRNEISIQSTLNGKKNGEKKQFHLTCHLAAMERHVNEVVFCQRILSLPIFFWYETVFHGVCYIYLVRIVSSMCFDFFSMLHFTVTNTCLKLPQWF